MRGQDFSSGPEIPFFSGSLFGSAIRMFADALTRDHTFTPGADASSPFSSHASSNEGLSRGAAGDVPNLPNRFVAQEAVAMTAEILLNPSRNASRLTWDLEDAGQYLGRLDQHGVEDTASVIKFHNTYGNTVAKATRSWILDQPKTTSEDVPLHKQGRGQVITLTQARTQATLAKVVEFAPWSYASPMTRWLNAFYTSFVIFNDRNEEEVLVRRYGVPRLFCHYRGIDTQGQRAVDIRLPFALVRWKTRWSIDTAPPESSDQPKKRGRLSSLIYPIMAAFHSIDTQQTSIFKRFFG